VSSFWIDTDRAWRATSSWAERGDAWFRTQFDLEADFSKLQLDGAAPSAVHELAAASTELWVNASFVRLVIDHVELSDGLGAVDSALVGRLRSQAGEHAQLSLSDACTASWATYSFSSRYGDRGETFDADVRSPLAVFGSSADERGRNLVIRALADTNDETQIRQDEFELVRLSTGSYLVVLPGVTDLSSTDLGLNDRHHTVRDVDQYAYPSSQSTSVADNRYAQMVWDGLISAGVPLGAELMIVGHSYGADTALDLAADPLFNGSAGFDVTHVIAAGYHSEPQLPHIDAGTEVLVLQNHRDAAVIAEAVGHGHVTGVVEETRSFFGSVFDLDPLGAAAHLAAKTYHEVGVVKDTASYLVGNADSIAQVGAGIAGGQPGWVAGAVADMVTIDPGVDQVTEHQIVDVFAGGGQGFGHHPANYVAHVAATTDPGVMAFFESVDAAGYTTSGTALAIDVSVPVHD
jgi:hypothetical protein